MTSIMLRRGSTIGAFVALACTAVLFAGSNPLAPESTAVFTITGTASHVDVAYGSGNANPIYRGSTLPFTKTIYGLMARDFVYITAEIDTNPDPGSITVTITKGGKTLYEASATGYSNSATAHGPF